MTKLIDCFCFFNELELLEIRLHELKDAVDCFVIVESNLTGSGREKPFYLEEHLHKFRQFPIVYIKHNVDKNIDNNYESRHNRMYQQREGFKSGIHTIQLQPTDYIMMSDLDEIPRGLLLQECKNNKILDHINSQFVTLVLRGSFYYVNTKFMSPENHVWFPCPIISRQSIFMNTDLKWLRNNKDTFPQILNAGWHFSHLGTPEILQQKMLASSHTEFSGDYYTSTENIKRRRDNLIDPYDRGYEIKRFDLDNDYPQYLLDNLERFKEFVL